MGLATPRSLDNRHYIDWMCIDDTILDRAHVSILKLFPLFPQKLDARQRPLCPLTRALILDIDDNILDILRHFPMKELPQFDK